LLALIGVDMEIDFGVAKRTAATVATHLAARHLNGFKRFGF
jgi:hypothetical protein